MYISMWIIRRQMQPLHVTGSIPHGMQEVLHLSPQYGFDDDGYITVNLEGMDFQKKEKEVSSLLETMVVMIRELERNYPKNIKLVEKEEK